MAMPRETGIPCSVNDTRASLMGCFRAPAVWDGTVSRDRAHAPHRRICHPTLRKPGIDRSMHYKVRARCSAVQTACVAGRYPMPANGLLAFAELVGDQGEQRVHRFLFVRSVGL